MNNTNLVGEEVVIYDYSEKKPISRGEIVGFADYGQILVGLKEELPIHDPSSTKQRKHAAGTILWFEGFLRLKLAKYHK